MKEMKFIRHDYEIVDGEQKKYKLKNESDDSVLPSEIYLQVKKLHPCPKREIFQLVIDNPDFNVEWLGYDVVTDLKRTLDPDIFYGKDWQKGEYGLIFFKFSGDDWSKLRIDFYKRIYPCQDIENLLLSMYLEDII